MAEKPELLIVDDEFNTREALARYLGRRFSVTAAADGAEAIEALKKRNFDLVLTDLRMPEVDGMGVLDAARAKAEPPLCILLTAYGSIGDAVAAVKHGAFDFIPKPVKLDLLETKLNAALASRRKTPAATPAATEDLPGGALLPTDPADPMTKVVETANRVAATRSTVLLTGESGSGKEVVARMIHNRSGRTGLFVAVHCAALTATLLESELFGHEKGAFTGAVERRRGRFELADHGTIFLDEIGEIDAATQVKLLRVLESRSFERVGGDETIQVDVRLIAATNRDLRKMVAEGSFREDLYYRLAVVTLELPPLRERRGEIPALAEMFRREFAAENAREVTGFTPEAMRLLTACRWPGNIRELRNTVESMVVLAAGPLLGVDDIPDAIRAESAASAVGAPAASEAAAGGTLEDTERALIARTLKECGGNVTRAAQQLGISRRTLHRRLAEAKREAEEGADGGDGSEG